MVTLRAIKVYGLNAISYVSMGARIESMSHQDRDAI